MSTSGQPGAREFLILNVDDHDAARYAKTRILRSAGYTVIEADRGEEALKLVRDRRPVVVLLDVKLPDMSGLDVCRMIKADPETGSTLIIQNSASFVGAADRVKGLEGGADTYLTAPVDPNVLVATVGALLRLGEAERNLRASQTQLHELVESERKAREAAERADRLKDEFVATLSHELRTPLTAIIGWTNILKSKGSDSETLAKGLEVIERNSKAQAQLIEDLLDMSRVLSGRLRLDVQNVDLRTVLENAVSALQLAADAKGIRIESIVHLPERPVHGDPDRLQQIVWNLLSNAIKFTPRDGMVQARVRGSDDLVEISVTDTGQGIDPAFLPHIFERFRQADASTTRRYGGLGIGLSVVKSLSELHGGTVRASSPGLGQGATFTVELPLSAPRQAEPVSRPGRRETAPVEARSHDVPRTTDLSGVRILAIDDDPDTRDLLRRLLIEAGGIVAVGCSAEEGIALLREFKPDVLISDIGMPGQDGFDLIRRIRAMDPKSGAGVPAAALTAMARPEDRARVLACGYQMHLAKPIQPAELVAAAASLAGR